jgi:hypothetical protein
VLCSSLGIAQAPMDEKDTRAAGVAAAAALAAYTKLVTPENYRSLGFETPDEIQRAGLGEPLADYFVRLDELQRYQPGSNAAALLQRSPQFLFPIHVGEATRSSLTVARVEREWKGVAFGSPGFIRSLSAVRSAKAAELAKAAHSFFLVRVPALQLNFVGHRQDQELLLTPTADDGRFGFKAGSTLPAAKVFETILPAAKSHDGSPI